MLEIFELELAKSRRRKRLFNKAFKIFKERIVSFIEKCKAKKEELEKEMLLLQERLKDLEKTNLDYYDLGVNSLELCRKAKILYENATFQEKQDLIHLALQKILIKDKAISFEYSSWFAILKKHSGLIKEICELGKDKILQGETANFEKIHFEMLPG